MAAAAAAALAPTSAAAPIPRIISIQSVMPTKVTPPGQSRRLTFAGPLLPVVIQSRFRIVLYYRLSGKEDSARIVAAWIKQSLSAALSEHPVLAGRIRQDGEREGYWEVKYNDAGLRMVEAAMEMTVEEVLGSEEREGIESGLCYWQDVDAENPNFSALLFMQVTEFQDNAYSIGISCNLLLTDPLFLTKFLKEWALSHNQMLVQGKLSKTPIHLGYFLKSIQPTQIKLEPSVSTTTTVNTTTILFKIHMPLAGCDTIGYNTLITRCIDEASTRIEGREMLKFLLLVRDQSGNLEIKGCTKDDLSRPNKLFDGAIVVACWNEFGVQDISLTGENKPVHVSYRIVSPTEQGLALVMVTSSRKEGDSELLISITIPIKI